MKLRSTKLIALAVLGLSLPLGAKAQTYTSGLYTANTLFIEAEDADYGPGQWVTTVPIGMTGPYPGGSYTNLGSLADLNIDWNTAGPNGQVYRADTSLSAGKEKGSGGNDRGTFLVTDWWTLGWNGAGDWENYTRPFPTTPQTYFVLGHLASGGNPIFIELDQVTAGVGQDDSLQVKSPLGWFNPGRSTAGWDSLELFPLVDTNNNNYVKTVTLAGTNTLRVTMMPGSAEDMDYFAFIPATAPLFLGGGAGTRDQIAAYAQDGPAPATVDTSSIAVTLDGGALPVTSTKVGGLTTMTSGILSPLFVNGSSHVLVVTYRDGGGHSYSNYVSFVVNTFITRDTKFIEAEDADYGVAQYVTGTEIGMNGQYAGGAFNGLGDINDLDIDWHTFGPNGQLYRQNTSLSAGKEFGSAGNDRGYFKVTDWWTLGWNGGGDWENYTRPFPAGPHWYEVYGHLASGGGAINLRLDKVTSGVGTTTQTLQTLGSFAPGRATAGWDSLEVFPLLTAPGGVQTVANLNGTTTLRITHVGAEDVDYIAFVPVSLPAATITINQQPQSVSVVQGFSATFSVGATTTSQYGISYQWNKNGSPITVGANGPVYHTPLLDLPDSGNQYTVTMSSPSASGFATVTSQAAVVTVSADHTSPSVVSVGALQNQLAGSEVTLIFDKPLNGSSAATAGHYTLDNGATVTSAYWVTNSSGFVNILPDLSRLPDRQQGVVLTVSALNPSTTYHLTVNGVSDYLGNTMGSVTLPVVQSSFTWVSLGNTTTNTANPNGVQNNTFAVSSNSWNLVNGGNAFWNNEDDVTFVYQPITGDFDKTEQVEWHDPSSHWARTGIMAREDVDPANAIGTANGGTGTPPRYQSVISDPETKFDGSAANDQYETNRRWNDGDATGGSNSGGRPTYPDSFVRLKRVGQYISMFSSPTGGNGPWMPVGTSDFDPADTAASLTLLTNVLYVGPMLGVENGNILGQGGVQDQTGDFVSRIRNYGDMGNKPKGNAAYAVGLKFGANEAGSQLAATDVAGVDVVAQAHWNNIFGNAPAGVTGIVAEQGGTGVATAIHVDSTGSGNTWSSFGVPHGEQDGALLTGNDAVMMCGYLDTGNATTTDVTLTGLPANLTGPGYDVVVYTLGGIAGRGGAFRVLDGLGTVTLRDYIWAQAPTDPTGLSAVIPSAGVNVPGTFIVFTNLTANAITVEATTTVGGFSGVPRAPINGVQLIAPAGLLASLIAPPPTVSITQSGGSVTITFTGVLRYSSTANGTYAPVAGATSPYTATTPGFYRASSQ